jgi:hypothetical protein
VDNPIFPLDPADPRPDTCLWSGWPEKTTRLTTLREPTPAPVDMVQCVCGEDVWIAADDRRWTWANELHRCPPRLTPLESAEEAFIDYSDIPDKGGDDAHWKGARIGPVLRRTQVTDAPKGQFSRDASGPEITDLVIE